MNKTVNYISRQRLPQYNSIEELFESLQDEIVNTCHIKKTEMPATGGDPSTILRNIKSFSPNKTDINHITGDVNYMALATGKNTVLTVHDIKSAIHGNIFRRFYILLLWYWLPAVFVKRITVISEFTKKELSKVIPFAKNKISVVHNPVNPMFTFKPKVFNSEKPIILLIGTKPNKNLECSLKAIQNIHCEVFIIGNLSEAQQKLLKELKIEYTNKTYIPFSEIVECYEKCDLVCFPSTYEGFGMPIIEAQKVGRPVLTSDFGAMAEAAGEGAYLVNPYDVNEIEKGLKDIIENENLREMLIKKGKENVKRFSLKEIAGQYLNIYKEMATP